ncbi:hypothetical protein [[Pseudomonas] boreopolis]|uniref:Uncharacterized protein n=1 Tax=Xanthomonas boreopolis TaxID=86183 RepID=A0A919KJC8_9XANT|nr:hypothetical protein GCM10009090_25260 [[Pseudomonas] boreopolis]
MTDWLKQQIDKEIASRLYGGSRAKYTINKLKRFVIRSIRVMAGGFLAIGAYIVFKDQSLEVGSLTLGQITINMLVGEISKGAILMLFLWLSWVIAFGAGPRIDNKQHRHHPPE